MAGAVANTIGAGTIVHGVGEWRSTSFPGDVGHAAKTAVQHGAENVSRAVGAASVQPAHRRRFGAGA